MKKRKYQENTEDIDRGLLPGLHHIDWKEHGESADHTKYGSNGKLRQNEKKKIHKVTV